jgi:hypothetical protein
MHSFYPTKKYNELVFGDTLSQSASIEADIFFQYLAFQISGESRKTDNTGTFCARLDSVGTDCEGSDRTCISVWIGLTW